MSRFLPDVEIERLLAMPKRIVSAPRPRHVNRANYRAAEWTISCEDPDAVFSVRIRENEDDPLDFSVILLHRGVTEDRSRPLLRCNGKHEHPIELGSRRLRQNRFHDFHVHRATVAAQEAGRNIDSHAAPTDAHHDLRGAMQAFYGLVNLRSADETVPLLAWIEGADDD